MKTCQECGNPLTGRQKQFCSIKCRNKPNGRKTGGWNQKAKIEKQCECCGITFHVHESRDKMYNVRACSRKCLGILQGAERKGRLREELGIQTYRRARKDACERCGAAENLEVHHINEDRYDNRLANLETLCRSCHRREHHRRKREATSPAA